MNRPPFPFNRTVKPAPPKQQQAGLTPENSSIVTDLAKTTGLDPGQVINTLIQFAYITAEQARLEEQIREALTGAILMRAGVRPTAAAGTDNGDNPAPPEEPGLAGEEAVNATRAAAGLPPLGGQTKKGEGPS